MSEFIILALPRTGSTLLQEALNARNDTVCHCELLHTRLDQRAIFAARVAKIKGLSDVDTGWLLGSAPADSRFAFNGSKEIASNLSADEMRRITAGRKVVYIERHPVAVAASLLRAHNTGAWNAYVDGTFMTGRAPFAQARKIFVNEAQIQELINAHDTCMQVLANVQHIRITYHELTTNTQAVYDVVCDFIGLPREPVTLNTKQLHETPVVDMIINLDEAQEWAGARFNDVPLI